jgi:hypothetical protein
LGYWGTWGTWGLSSFSSNIVSPLNGCLTQSTKPQHRLIFLHLDCSAVLQKDITKPITIPHKASSPVSVKEIQLIYIYFLFLVSIIYYIKHIMEKLF